ncbi:reverse transcriptase domain-containing protein [Tanacetum coccineum]
MVSGPETQQHVINQVTKEKIKVAIHPEYPKQTIAIGSTLTEEGRTELCGLLRHNLDIFAWKPADMTGVPRHLVEHRLNIREGCLPVRQKKRGQVPERNKAIYEEVEKLVNAGIMKEVHYHSWLSNPVMVKKHDDSWRMCVDFKDLNKACPKDGYQLPKIDWKVCPDKVETVLSFLSPKCLKDVQRLNEKLASLSRFLYKSAEKSLPFFKFLKRCTKKSDFQWTAEAETTFEQMKKLIAELPMLTAPKEKEELIIYLAAAKEAISAVLMTERDGKQVPIYFFSRALQEVTGRLLKWSFELEEYDIHYRPRTSVKEQILADFIVERPEDDPPDTPMEDKEELLNPWVLFTDGSSCIDDSGAELILTNPEGAEFTYTLSASSSREEGCTWMTPIHEYLTEEILPEEKRKARAIRCKAGRYAMTNGILYKKSFLGPWLRCVRPLQENYVLREIYEGSCNMHAGPRSVVAKALRLGLESKVMRECCFVVERDAWLRGEFTLSSLDVLQGFSFFLQMGFTLILATLDGLDVGLLGDVIGEDDCDDDG